MTRFLKAVAHAANFYTVISALVGIAAAFGVTQYVRDHSRVGEWAFAYVVAFWCVVFAAMLIAMRIALVRIGVVPALAGPKKSEGSTVENPGLFAEAHVHYPDNFAPKSVMPGTYRVVTWYRGDETGDWHELIAESHEVAFTGEAPA